MPDANVKTQWQLGADVSSAVGPFDVHVEAAITHGNKSLFLTSPLTGTAIAAAFTTPGGGAPLPAQFRDDVWIPQVVAGTELSLKYSDDDAVTLGVEYFYNGAGFANGSIPLYEQLALVGNFTPFYLGRDYLAVSASLPNPGSWNNTTFTASNLVNLSDKSALARLDYTLTALTYMTFRAFGQYHYGDAGEFKFGGAFAGLPTGTAAAVNIKPVIWDLGVGFILNI
jgi:hypothetical protein